MTASPLNRVRVALRGPVRNGLRQWQAAHRIPLDSRRPGPPDYVGIGVQRCGTSWWHSLIEAHPRVASLGWGAKELHFFDAAWSDDDPTTRREQYAAQFRRRPGQLAGEWTPRYLYDPWAVPALLCCAPDVRLLVMLRDPVARFVSGLGHELKIRAQLDPDAVTAAFERGLYAAQLSRLLRVVEPSRVMVLQFERCRQEPARFLNETFDFLGLDSIGELPEGSRNEARRRVIAPGSLLETVASSYREDAARLADLVPGRVDLDLWRGLTA